MPNLLTLSSAGDQGFELRLADDSVLECQRIVRRVSGKRLVCRGTWRGRPVYAKIFLGPHARRHAERDRQGALWLIENNLPTPPLLHAAALPKESAEILIYAEIEAANTAEAVMHSLEDSTKRLELALAVTLTVANHHQAQLLQTDLYLKNFLVQGQRIYTLDGDGIRRLKGWLAQRAAWTNLATLWSKLDASDDDFIPQLYAAYCEQRRWLPQQARLDSLRRQVRRIRHAVIAEYADRKVFRECTDVHIARSTTQFLTVARNWVGQAEQLLANPDALLEQGNRLKTGNTCTVGMIEFGGRKIVVKRYNIKNLRHGLGRALRKSRAALSWANTYRLRIAGMATAQPVAMLEERWGFIRRRAWFLAEYVEGPDIAEWMAQVSAEQQHQAAHGVAKLLHKMQRLRFAHGDLKATNIKIANGQPVLIDLDSLKEYHCDWLFRRRHARDLRRLLKNWQNDTAVLAVITQALHDVYGNDPVLAGAIRD